MWAWLRDLSIRRKLVAVIMLTSGVALIVASAALLLLDALRYQDDLTEDLETLAAVVGDNSAAALMFRDFGAARENVAALAVKPSVEVAALYSRDDIVFAEYRRTDAATPAPDTPQVLFADRRVGAIEVVREVAFRGEPVGTIYVRGTLDELYGLLFTRALTVGLILLAAWLLTLVLSSWLQHLIADPLLQLAGTARRVSLDQDYSLRATPHGRRRDWAARERVQRHAVADPAARPGPAGGQGDPRAAGERANGPAAAGARNKAACGADTRGAQLRARTDQP
jgi:hypothetical protein